MWARVAEYAMSIDIAWPWRRGTSGTSSCRGDQVWPAVNTDQRSICSQLKDNNLYHMQSLGPGRSRADLESL